MIMDNNCTLENLHVCHVNTQSLVAHWDEFCLYFQRRYYHIICLSETWLRPEIPDGMINLPGYTIFRRDRIGKIGGGVAFYLLNELNARILRQSEDLYCRKPEFIIAEILPKAASGFLLAVVYRPPNYGYLQEFENIFYDLQVNYKNAIILGDFNIDMNSDCYDSGKLRLFLTAASLFLVPFRATHHLNDSSTFLDLCFVDDRDRVLDFGQCDVNFLSAHDLIYVKYDIKIQRLQNRGIHCRDLTKFDKDIFLSEINELEWEQVMTADNIDDKVSIFTSFLYCSYNKHAPIRLMNFKSRPAPWLSPEIKELMRERNRIRRNWRKYRDPALYTMYKMFRNEVQVRVRAAKQDFYRAAFNRMGSTSRVWNDLRHLGLVRPRNRSASNLALSADDLNEFFTRASNSGNILASLDFVLNEINYNDSDFHWRNITPETINRTLFRIQSNSAGVDALSLKLMKIVMPVVMPIVEHVFNFSFAHGVFPDIWKTALVTPISKVKNPTSPQDYRPISIFPLLSKVLERIAGEQIQSYLEEKNLYDPYQSAYRREHSTQTCLIKFLDDVRNAGDSRLITIAVSIDFSKAFDRVNHFLLLNKLKQQNFSCSVLRWFYSYLSSRRQAVKDPCQETISSYTVVEAGVPQGSVLGPLLFTIYTSDLSSCLRHCRYNSYADDLVIYLHWDPHDVHNGIKRITEDIQRINEWSISNAMVINSTKTQAIIIGTDILTALI